MKISDFNVYFLLFLFVLSFFLSTSNQTARWGLDPEETFGFTLFVFFLIFLSNAVITVIAESKMTSRYSLASVLTQLVMLVGGGVFSLILSFAIYAKNYDYRHAWLFATLAIIYIATITTYARLKKYNHKKLAN